jgi:hypothetical protein
MDTPRAFPQAFSLRIQNAFDRRASICEPAEEPVIDPDTINWQKLKDLALQQRHQGCVRLDSVRMVDSSATVHATVALGEAVHHEDFTALFATARKQWIVTEMRASGLWYAHGARGTC